MDKGELDLILVTGAARSGTSVITSMLQACGANLGSGDHINELYENLHIREKLLKPMLEYYGGDRRGQVRFPRKIEYGESVPFEIEEAFITAGLTGHDDGIVDVYKDAKLILLWEVFQQELDDVEWLIVRRPREQIIDSCMRTHFMNGRKTLVDWSRWVDYHEDRIADLKSNCENWEEVWSNEIIEDPEDLEGLVEWYGLDFNYDAVMDCIDPNKYKT